MVSQRFLLLPLFCSGAAAFSVPGAIGSKSATSLSATPTDDTEFSRRSFFSASAAVIATFTGASAAQAVQEVETRQGIQVNAFNGLIFNYRNSQFGGLEAGELNEPSVSYSDFCERLKAGEVEFVEFLAPDGDAAYVTFKPKDGQAKQAPIRIGEGYPIEQHDGWSSPAFAVRTVKNAGVPYKFTVPGLAKYSSQS
jgi:hypothetical protein